MSLTVAENYILKYPESNLRVQEKLYYGYPKDIPQKMTNLVDPGFDWKNSKIAVVNDFGFQLIRYLHFTKNVAFKNITSLFVAACKEDAQKISQSHVKRFSAELSFTGLNFDYIDLENKMNPNKNFDLIIANPPYGKGSSLSRKIVNVLHENKTAKQMIVLAPPKTFFDVLTYIDYKSKAFKTSEAFDICAANGIDICYCSIWQEEIGKYTTLEDFSLNDKQKLFLSKIAEYNADREDAFETPGWITAAHRNVYKDIDESRIVLIGMHAPGSICTGWLQRDGEPEDHNLKGLPIKYRDRSPWALVFRTQRESKGFIKYFYKNVDTHRARPVVTYGFNILVELFASSPSSRKYKMVLPNVDWSKEWTDEDLLEEIGLPRDFLKGDPIVSFCESEGRR